MNLSICVIYFAPFGMKLVYKKQTSPFYIKRYKLIIINHHYKQYTARLKQGGKAGSKETGMKEYVNVTRAIGSCMSTSKNDYLYFGYSDKVIWQNQVNVNKTFLLPCKIVIKKYECYKMIIK